MRDKSDFLLSVIVPVLNEAECLPVLIARLEKTLASVAPRHELIFVDDHSSDESFTILERETRRNPAVKCLRLSRTFGHQAALTCGLHHAAGDVIVSMDADLQHPPEFIPELLAPWRQGFDVVNTARRHGESVGLLERTLSQAFYRIFNWISDVELTRGGSDFRLLDRVCVDALMAMPESLKFYRGLVQHIGFNQTTLACDFPARMSGTRRYTFSDSMRLALHGIFAFATLPLKLPLYLGLAVLTWAGLRAFDVIPASQAADAAFPMAVLGVLLCSVGSLGLYVGALLHEARRRPVYFVSASIGITGCNRRTPEKAGRP